MYQKKTKGYIIIRPLGLASLPHHVEYIRRWLPMVVDGVYRLQIFYPYDLGS
jgi:hypothetical protein